MTGVDGLNDLRDSMTSNELSLVDGLMDTAFSDAKIEGVTLYGDDRAAKAEAALCRWVIESRGK